MWARHSRAQQRAADPMTPRRGPEAGTNCKRQPRSPAAHRLKTAAEGHSTHQHSLTGRPSLTHGVPPLLLGHEQCSVIHKPAPPKTPGGAATPTTARTTCGSWPTTATSCPTSKKSSPAKPKTTPSTTGSPPPRPRRRRAADPPPGDRNRRRVGRCVLRAAPPMLCTPHGGPSSIAENPTRAPPVERNINGSVGFRDIVRVEPHLITVANDRCSW